VPEAALSYFISPFVKRPLLAREQRDRNTECEKLTAALDIFTELNLPRERDAVKAELEKTAAAD
jgi:hypothetical protein